MKLKVETPPNLIGTPEQQLRGLYSYLFRLAENLNVALSNLDADNGSSAAQSSGSTQAEAASVSGDAYYELRALILNTANSIKVEIGELQTETKNRFGEIITAWSSVQENNDTRLTALENHAKACTEYQTETDAKLEQLTAQAETFSAHITESEKYFNYDEETDVMNVGCAMGCTGLNVSGAVLVSGQTLEEYILAVVNNAAAGEGSE